MAKVRLDKLLVERGHVTSRERAQALILAGRVLVAEQKVDKPGAPVAADATLRLLGDDMRYVSRGGLKLQRALEHWSIDLAGRSCVDVGASTGGFTDCMLQHGAAHVLAIDTGYGQIAHRLREDTRVSLRERTNARLLAPGELAVSMSPHGERASDIAAAAAFVAMDVSFISATLVLPAVLGALAEPGERWSGELVVLVKPQFEAGREWVGKGGIVRDARGWERAVERVMEAVRALDGGWIEVIESPIRGAEGNVEFLLHAVFASEIAAAEPKGEAPVH